MPSSRSSRSGRRASDSGSRPRSRSRRRSRPRRSRANRWRRHLKRRQGGAPRVLIFTHELTLGGAQLYLLELLTEMVAKNAIDATVVSTLDGLLRGKLADLGIPTHVTSMVAIEGGSAHRGRVEELAAWASEGRLRAGIRQHGGRNSLPGSRSGQPARDPGIWAIHESLEPPVLWGPQRRCESVPRSNWAAAAVASSLPRRPADLRALAEGESLPDDSLRTRSEPIESEREGFDPAARHAATPGSDADADLIVCVGSVEPRKAQVSLTQAFERSPPPTRGAHLALVGDRRRHAACCSRVHRDSPFADRMRLIPVTPDVGVVRDGRHPGVRLGRRVAAAHRGRGDGMGDARPRHRNLRAPGGADGGRERLALRAPRHARPCGRPTPGAFHGSRHATGDGPARPRPDRPPVQPPRVRRPDVGLSRTSSIGCLGTDRLVSGGTSTQEKGSQSVVVVMPAYNAAETLAQTRPRSRRTWSPR